MFTFSFNTAFAAKGQITDKAEGYVDAAYTKALADLKTVYEAYVNTAADQNVTHEGVTALIEADAFKEVAAKVYADYQKVLADQLRQIKADDKVTDWDTITSVAKATELFTGETYKAEKAYVGDVLDGAYYGEVVSEENFADVVKAGTNKRYEFDLLKSQLNLTKAYVAGELAKVDLDAYSDNVVDKNDPFKETYKEAAAAVVSKIKDQVALLAVDEDREQKDAAWVIADAMNLLGKSTWDGTKFNRTPGTSKTFAAALIPNSEYKGIDDVVVVTSYILKGAKTADGKDIITEIEENHGAVGLDAERAKAKANIAKTAAEAYNNAFAAYKAAGYTAAAKKVFEEAQDRINAFKEVTTFVVDKVDTSAEIDAWGNFNVTSVDWSKRVNEYAALEKLAASAKITTDKLGDLIYDAEAIDDNLAALKVKIYKEGKTGFGYDDVVSGAEISSEDLAWEKEVAKAQVEKARAAKLYAADGTDVYYAPEAEKVNAVYDAVIAKIDACTTVAQVEKVAKATITVPATIKTAEQVDSAMTTIVNGLTNEIGMAKNYIAWLNNGLLATADGYRAIDETLLKEIMVEAYVEAGARTAAEAKAHMDAVYAAIDAYPTVGKSAASVKAVEDAIKALPKAITAADKEAVKAAFKAYNDLTAAEKESVKASTKTLLNNAVAASKFIDEKAIDDAFKALPELNKLTAADYDAVSAVAKLVEAYETEEMYIAGNKFADYTKYNEVAYLNAVRDAHKADVEAQIYKLGTNPSVDEVEAARDAYDAFVARWKDAKVPYKATIKNEARLLVAEKFVEKQLISRVQSMKLRAYSKYAKKGITVKWVIEQGRKSAADGYQVFRSVKKDTAYKKLITVKGYGVNNAKNLKKGTTYYYKVRAYKRVDGKLYFSDWSNKAHRKAK